MTSATMLSEPSSTLVNSADTTAASPSATVVLFWVEMSSIPSPLA
jgi:hypothetical protein